MTGKKPIPVFTRFEQEAIWILENGGVGVIPTDTIYGVVGSALSAKTIARIYKLRERNAKKPMIVLIGSFAHLKKFDVKLKAGTKRFLNKFWPGKVSVVLAVPEKKFAYLHCGARSIAFRLPKDKQLQKLLLTVGPLVAPSANIEGQPPADTITAAKKYFGEKVDFYVDVSAKKSAPSTLVKVRDGKAVILRKGAIHMK